MPLRPKHHEHASLAVLLLPCAFGALSKLGVCGGGGGGGDMQRNAVVVVADKTSLKRPFIFACAVNMALCFFMLTMTAVGHRDLLQAGQLVSNVSVVILYILEIACLLLSVLGVFGACTGRRWCLILFAAGMAAASQTIIVKTALSYQDIYETGVAREESKLLSMMPLSATSKVNRTLLHSIQAHFKCCGLVEGYKDWGTAIPASCHCHSPGKCIRLRGSATLGAPKNQYVYQEACLQIYVSALKRAFSLAMGIKFGSGVFWAVLLVMSLKLMVQMKRKQEFMALLQSNRYVPGAF
ncbi:tetraspanin-8-like isoform X1 [Phyllopteryx taeniolatus]|uniref:tetraspanin-8-like isoform X1 n=1 Tax=Phyllopteryx taeniolatus TaxID=161469 RepID=UPI002AD459A8|nr:tetraspanin-8-like isoform X1 [Phyllopteryx taeniolatus]